MEIRMDLDSVKPLISRLLSLGTEFGSFDKDWSHLKNKEDFQYVSRVPYCKRYEVEKVYADGRNMAACMHSALLSINNDFSKYPTLTAIVESFKDSWAYGNYDPEVPNVSEKICADHKINLWSIDQMVLLFKKQEKLLLAVRFTLQMLEDSDLYKIENGSPIMKQEANIQVSGVSGSSININSSGATANVVKSYNEPEIFADIISAIRYEAFEDETERALIDNVQLLADSHLSGSYKETYKDFMQNVSAHISVFTPFISGLSSLL